MFDVDLFRYFSFLAALAVELVASLLLNGRPDRDVVGGAYLFRLLALLFLDQALLVILYLLFEFSSLQALFKVRIISIFKLVGGTPFGFFGHR